MKTSNKLLLSAGAGVVMGFISFLISLRTNMVEYENITIEGDGSQKIEIRIDHIESNSFRITGDFEIQLDPNATTAKISGDSNVVGLVDILDKDGGLSVKWTERNINLKKSMPIVITLGTAGKAELKVRMDDNSTLSSLDTLSVDYFEFEGRGNQKSKIDLITSNANINLNDNAELSLQGKANSLILESSGNGKLRGHSLVVDHTQIDLDDNSEFWLREAGFIGGELNANAHLHFGGDMNVLRTREKDNSAVSAL